MAKKIHRQADPAERLGDLLRQSLSRLEVAQQLEAYAVWPVWNDVVGKPVARNAQPERIRNGTLFVKVSSPVWMQQLQFMKEHFFLRRHGKLSRSGA
jgi:predicted nucleic acid-binding Zn ribbon protein